LLQVGTGIGLGDVVEGLFVLEQPGAQTFKPVHLRRLGGRHTLEGIQGRADRLRIHVAHQLADELQLTSAGLVGGEALVILDRITQVFVNGYLCKTLLAQFGQLAAEILQGRALALERGLAGAGVFFVFVVFVLGHRGAGSAL
jgi:hypothetical protein